MNFNNIFTISNLLYRNDIGISPYCYLVLHDQSPSQPLSTASLNTPCWMWSFNVCRDIITLSAYETFDELSHLAPYSSGMHHCLLARIVACLTYKMRNSNGPTGHIVCPHWKLKRPCGVTRTCPTTYPAIMLADR